MRAIDIALLLPPTQEQKVVQLNQSLQTSQQLIDMLATGSLPHISLSMVVVDDKELKSLAEQLSELASRYDPIHITHTGLHEHKLTAIDIELTEELQTLHNDVMHLSSPYTKKPTHPPMFTDSEEVSETTCQRVKNFPTTSAFEKFRPHITLGSGKLPDEITIDGSYTTDRLAIGHLGQYCTIRKILAEEQLT